MEALQLMISTYTETPNFGDAKKFQEELESVSTKVGNLSQDLISLNRELDLVESKMNLNMRHSLLATTSRSLLSLDNSSLSGGSDSTGYGSQESNDAVDKGGDSHDTNEEVTESEEIKYSGDRITSVSSHMKSTPITNKCEDKDKDIIEDNDDKIEVLSDDSDEFGDDPLPLSHQCVVAMYYYDGAEEGTLTMQEGEEFVVTSQEVDGWIKVKRRADPGEEGYVPFAFTQIM